MRADFCIAQAIISFEPPVEKETIISFKAKEFIFEKNLVMLYVQRNLKRENGGLRLGRALTPYLTYLLASCSRKHDQRPPIDNHLYRHK